jgi:hypothetical protein
MMEQFKALLAQYILFVLARYNWNKSESGFRDCFTETYRDFVIKVYFISNSGEVIIEGIHISNWVQNTLVLDYTFNDCEYITPFQFLSGFDRMFVGEHGNIVYNKSFDFVF